MAIFKLWDGEEKNAHKKYLNSGWRPRWGRVSTGPRREQKRSHTAEFIRKKNTLTVIFLDFLAAEVQLIIIFRFSFG